MGRSLTMSRRDIDFCLYEWLDVTSLLDRPRFAEHGRETLDAVLELSETLAVEHFAPLNRDADTHEPYVGDDGRVVTLPALAKALQAYSESGLPSSTFDEGVGGMQLPFTVHQAATSFFQAASIGAFAYPFLAQGNANLVAAHGTPEQVETYARPIVEGRWYGTMCLSEPQAGSSLSDITTRAEPQDDGTWRLTGTKMWISGGDHELSENIVHLVLARTPGAPAGVKGVSLFIVPKVLVEDDGSLGGRNDVSLVGLNHKMGYRATTNTLLNFGEGAHQPGGRAGAVGHLVGEENRGLTYMFHMMNEARVSVGAGAMALGYTGFLHSLAYAEERTQGRPVGDKDPAAPPVPLTRHADVRRMLLAQKSYVEGGLGLILYCARLVDEEQTATSDDDRRRAHALLELLTPIAKSWPSQWCVTANDLAIQVLGGAGYTRDFPVEQLYRDNRLNPIHEGTHGIQALDLLGRKVLGDGGRGLGELLAVVRATVARAEEVGGETAAHGIALAAAVERLERTTQHVAAAAADDAELALANATPYLEATGHLVVAWVWLEQVLAAAGKEGAFYDGKRAAARYFYAFEVPSIITRLDLVASLDRTTLDLDPGVL
ncbi:MAG: acyl-CoA dehydrogenase [Nocardioidaceae bacterium]|nr:acyl-CoA dehydrogenase [Nocardioidaceae bacterium]